MSRDRPFAAEPEDTDRAILKATYEVLGEHGYSRLSVGRIATQADLSKSSVYHFYDDKEDLLVAFLDVMLEWFQGRFAGDPDEDPSRSLSEQVEDVFLGVPPGAPSGGGQDTQPPFGPFIELRAQAITNPTFRERFDQLDGLFETQLSAIIERGIEEKSFREVDPDRGAAMLLTMLMGAVLRRATSEGFDGEMIHRAVEQMLDRYLRV